MAACVDHYELCIEVVTDPEDDDKILIRETDPALGSGPDVWVKTSRENWIAFRDGVKAGDFDNV